METVSFKVGDPVIFGRGNGEQTRGEVLKVNRKTVKVKTTETRGTKRGYDIGTVWKVPFTLCHHAESTQPTATKPARPESEVMRDIVGVYGGLSPENLSCDGECSMSQIRRRRASLNRQLRELEQEIGRKVSEDEAYRFCYPR